MEIWEKIRKIRLLKDYTQKYMAAELGMTQAGYSKIERGGCDISVLKLYKICEILDYDFNDILFEKEVLYAKNIRDNKGFYNDNLVEKLLKSIDSYQKQITKLEDELSLLKGDENIK